VLKAAIFLAIAMISLSLTSLPIVLRPLELNLKLQEMFPRIPVIVKWTGEADVSESELEDYFLEEVSGQEHRQASML
jgi:hypothetical protein